VNDTVELGKMSHKLLFILIIKFNFLVVFEKFYIRQILFDFLWFLHLAYCKFGDCFLYWLVHLKIFRLGLIFKFTRVDESSKTCILLFKLHYKLIFIIRIVYKWDFLPKLLICKFCILILSSLIREYYGVFNFIFSRKFTLLFFYWRIY
jgi:hypothetical protein